MVVVLHEVGDDRFGLQIIITVIVVALIAYGAVEAFDDAIGLRMSGPGFDIDQVMRLDHRRDIAIDELAAVIVHDSRFGVFGRLERPLELDRHRLAVEAH